MYLRLQAIDLTCVVFCRNRNVVKDANSNVTGKRVSGTQQRMNGQYHLVLSSFLGCEADAAASGTRHVCVIMVVANGQIQQGVRKSPNGYLAFVYES